MVHVIIVNADCLLTITPKIILLFTLIQPLKLKSARQNLSFIKLLKMLKTSYLIEKTL